MSAPAPDRRDDILERNLGKLMRRYAAARPRAEFRAELRLRVLGDPDSRSMPRRSPILRRFANGPLLAAAAALVVTAAGLFFARDRFSAPDRRDTLESILARGDVATRILATDEFAAAESRGAAYAPPRLEIATPVGRGFGIELPAALAAGLDVAESSRIVVATAEDGSPDASLLSGGTIIHGIEDTGAEPDGKSLDLVTRHVSLRIDRGRVDVAYVTWPDDPPGDPSVRVRIDDAAAHLLPAGTALPSPCDQRYRDGRLVDSGGVPPQREAATVSPPSTSELPTPESHPVPDAPATAELKGVVRAYGRPVAPYRLVVVTYESENHLHDYESAEHGIDAADGSYSIALDYSGSIRLFVLADGFAAGVSDLLNVKRGDAPRDVAFDLVEGAKLAGRVTDARSGEPLEGVLVFSENEVPFASIPWTAIGMEHWTGVPARAARTGEDGGFVIEHVQPGAPLLRAQKAGFAPHWQTIDGLRDLDVRAGIELSLDRGGRIHGTVRDDQGAPRSRSVLIGANQTLGVPAIDRPMAVGAADEQGRYEIVDLPAGLYTVIDLGPEAAGFDPGRVRLIALADGGDVQIDFGPPTGACRVRGRLVDASGSPVANATLSLASAEAGYEINTDWRSAMTGADGGFELERVEPGAYALFRIRSNDAVERIGLLDVPDRPEFEFEARLSPFVLAGTIVDAATGAPVEKAYLLILALDPTTDDARFAGRLAVGAGGAFEVPNLVAGKYGVAVVPFDQKHACRFSDPIPVGPGSDAAAVRILLAPCGTVRITARDSAGAVVPVPEVGIVDGAGMELGEIILPRRETGCSAVLEAVPAGELKLTIEVEGFEPFETRIRIDEGRETRVECALRARK